MVTRAMRKTLPDCCSSAADRAGRYLAYLHQHGLPLSEANFSCYADHSVAHWGLVCQGLGIGAMMDEIAQETPGVIRVLDDVPAGAISHLAGHAH